MIRRASAPTLYHLVWAASIILYQTSCTAFQVTTNNSISGHVSIHNNNLPITTTTTRWYQSVPNSFFFDVDDDTPLTLPHIEMSAQEAVTTCMDALLHNDSPRENAGLETCFEFSSDRCRASLGGSLQNFILYASNPTFGSMVGATGFTVVNVGPVIAGTNTRGAMQTVLVNVTPANDGKDRHFLW